MKELSFDSKLSDYVISQALATSFDNSNCPSVTRTEKELILSFQDDLDENTISNLNKSINDYRLREIIDEQTNYLRTEIVRKALFNSFPK
jgi:His-Xaa-Ser system protein HxsD